jgi:hypothetical protein
MRTTIYPPPNSRKVCGHPGMHEAMSRLPEISYTLNMKAVLLLSDAWWQGSTNGTNPSSMQLAGAEAVRSWPLHIT